MCAAFQIFTDLCILSQFILYRSAQNQHLLPVSTVNGKKGDDNLTFSSDSDEKPHKEIESNTEELDIVETNFSEIGSSANKKAKSRHYPV